MKAPMNREWIGRACLGVIGVASAVLAGCTPKIGDHCVLNTDCGTSGTLICDTSMPGGYCTQFNCQADKCQNSAACVEFLASVPGCPYDDYLSPARTGRTFCLKTCQKDSDCRQSEGYVCRSPTKPPWSAVIVDDNQSEQVCIVGPSASMMPDGSGFDGTPPICAVGLGDAVAPAIDAGVVLEADGAPVEGGDGGSDSASDASDGATEEGAAVPDASIEAAGGAADGAADALDGE
jgi:hypothetical protein